MKFELKVDGILMAAWDSSTFPPTVGFPSDPLLGVSYWDTGLVLLNGRPIFVRKWIKVYENRRLRWTRRVGKAVQFAKSKQ